ncbi:hypothetical protein BH09BAC5_BH09BAC5_00700 [soil metagenome]
MTEHLKDKLPPEGAEYAVPPEGSLGLLALGYRGLVAWRNKREEAKKRIEMIQKAGNDSKEKS